MGAESKGRLTLWGGYSDLFEFVLCIECLLKMHDFFYMYLFEIDLL